ncbi:MAG: DUF806 family protein [Lactobacillus sp.]|nr:DUF806 family protein [Lactobacillus sp.]
MMPVDELAADIKTLQLNWVQPQNIICTNMTDGAKNDVNNTILFLSEVTNQPANHANDFFKGWLIVVELQVFWAIDPNVESIQISEIDLMKNLIDLGWLVQSSSPHVTDPDTGQVTKTIYFTKKEEIR